MSEQHALGNGQEGVMPQGLAEHAPVGIKDAGKFRLRVIFSFVALGLIIAGLLAGEWGIAVLLMVACWFASQELFNLFEARGYKPARTLSTIGSLGVMALAAWSGTAHQAAFLAIWFVVVLISLVFRGAPNRPFAAPAPNGEPEAMATIADVSTTILAVIYTGWLPSFIILLRKFAPDRLLSPEGLPYQTASGAHFHYPSGVWITFLFFLTVMGSDIGAFFAGKFLGRRPLIGPLSPRKTLEGSIGGTLLSVLVGVVIGLWGPAMAERFSWAPAPGPWWQCAVLALLVSVVSQFSDLVESLLKRDAGLRDSGGLIPGHGGMLDRVDSYLLSGAVAYWYIIYFWKLVP